MRYMLRIVAAAAVIALPAFAQNAISARAGMINVADGDVWIVDAKGGEPRRVEPKPSEIIELKEGDILRTSEGRAEVLLTPGAFLRIGEESSFKLVGNRLSDVRLDVLSGSVLVEVVEYLDGNSITVLARDATASLVKAGIYRFDAEPGRVRVYQGEARVEIAGSTQIVKGSRELVASATGWNAMKFDDKEGDALFRWAKRRSGYIAMANVSAARGARDSFSSAYSCGSRCGMWAYNPYYGFATYLPWRDTLRNPFGYYFYTPSSVMAVFAPRPVYSPGYGGGGGGYSGGWARGAYSDGMSSLPSRSASGGYSGGGVSSAPAPSAPAASAPAARGGEGAGARGGSSAGGRGQ